MGILRYVEAFFCTSWKLNAAWGRMKFCHTVWRIATIHSSRTNHQHFIERRGAGRSVKFKLRCEQGKWSFRLVVSSYPTAPNHTVQYAPESRARRCDAGRKLCNRKRADSIGSLLFPGLNFVPPLRSASRSYGRGWNWESQLLGASSWDVCVESNLAKKGRNG